MDTISKFIDSLINIIASIFSVSALIVVITFAWDYTAATSAKFWMDSPTTYNVHEVVISQHNKIADRQYCNYIELEGHKFRQSIRNEASCSVPESILTNWEDHGENYRKLGFKFWAGNIVLFVMGVFVMSWMPARMFGMSLVGVLGVIFSFLTMGLFVAFFTVQEVRAAYAPPKNWYVIQSGMVYRADVKFYLQDKQGQVYYWSAAGTADANRVTDLGEIVKDPVK